MFASPLRMLMLFNLRMLTRDLFAIANLPVLLPDSVSLLISMVSGYHTSIFI